MRALNTTLSIILASGYLMSQATANVRVPTGAFMSEDYAAAKAKAVDEGKGILFIQCNIHTDNRDTRRQLESVMRFMLQDVVVVVVPTEGVDAFHNSNIPDRIRNQMRHGTMPGLPRIVLTDREAGETVHRLVSAKLKEDERGELRALKEKAQTLAENQGLSAKAASRPDEDGAMPPAPDAGPEPPAPVYLNLTNVDGNSIRAAVLGLEGDTVKFRREDGVEFEYPMGQLNETSQGLVREQSGGAE